jgi:hypothetical protein
LTFKTNTGRLADCEGLVGRGAFHRELNLREHSKGVIGFRGIVSTHILDLYMYVSLRLDIISEVNY